MEELSRGNNSKEYKGLFQKDKSQGWRDAVLYYKIYNVI